MNPPASIKESDPLNGKPSQSAATSALPPGLLISIDIYSMPLPPYRAAPGAASGATDLVVRCCPSDPGGAMESSTSVRDLEDRVAKLQRAVYYLIWKRTGFGEQCVHCGHAYPAHAERCKAAEVEGLVR